ncbi:MAG: helix-turn-helix transcriptional regulator, partial [Pseudonocardia sp.]|nr:helix-turn-helix transcriptional regulator [Pseudonocardia sp.]
RVVAVAGQDVETPRPCARPRGAVWPGPGPPRSGQTGREREIATLIAAGLSNRAIADRLVLSVRTVEGHTYRACGKLDLTDRAALRGMLDGA